MIALTGGRGRKTGNVASTERAHGKSPRTSDGHSLAHYAPQAREGRGFRPSPAIIRRDGASGCPKTKKTFEAVGTPGISDTNVASLNPERKTFQEEEPPPIRHGRCMRGRCIAGRGFHGTGSVWHHADPPGEGRGQGPPATVDRRGDGRSEERHLILGSALTGGFLDVPGSRLTQRQRTGGPPFRPRRGKV
jgi:hypothetical protein